MNQVVNMAGAIDKETMKMLDYLFSCMLGILGGGIYYLNSNMLIANAWGGIFYAGLLGAAGVLGRSIMLWILKIIKKQIEKLWNLIRQKLR